MPFSGFVVGIGLVVLGLRRSFVVTVGSASCSACQCWDCIRDAGSPTHKIINRDLPVSTEIVFDVVTL